MDLRDDIPKYATVRAVSQRAKSRDHELWEPKRGDHPWHFQNHVVWSRAFNHMLFQRISIHAHTSQQYNKSMVARFQNAMISRFCAKPTSKRWVLTIAQVTTKHYPFDAMYKIHVEFTYFVGPVSVVWTELGPAPPFPPMRMCLKSNGHGPSVSCMMWP